MTFAREADPEQASPGSPSRPLTWAFLFGARKGTHCQLGNSLLILSVRARPGMTQTAKRRITDSYNQRALEHRGVQPQTCNKVVLRPPTVTSEPLARSRPRAPSPR
jgi:hypothetical protein